MEKGKGASPMRRLDWAVAATSGTFMVGAVVAGLLIGVWLDKRFGIDPIGKAIGVILGGVAGTVELVRMLLQVSRRERNQP
jgi:F0F1-type ATP synthase assembly protein I